MFFSILSSRARSTFRILPRIGRMAWVRGSRARTAVPPAESPSTMNSSLSRGSWLEQSFSLSGMPTPDRPVLRRMALRAFLAATAGLGRADGLLDDPVGLGRVLEQPLGQLVVGDLLHQRADGDVAQLGLGLALELGLAQLHRDDGGEALPDVLAEEVLVLLLEQRLLAERAYSLTTRVRADLKPSTCMPPSMVAMPLA